MEGKDFALKNASEEITFNGSNIEFDLPLYICPFDTRPVPSYANEVINEIIEENKDIFESYHAPTLFNGLPNMEGFFFHMCAVEKKRLKVLALLYLGFNYGDDMFDGKESVSTNNFDICIKIKDIIKNKPVELNNNNPIYFTMLKCWQEISITYTKCQRDRLSRIFAFVIQELTAEKSLKSGEKTQEEVKNIVFEVLQETHDIANYTRGTCLCLLFNEYALGIEISDNQWNDEVFQQFFNLCARAMCIWNDVVSFRKEVLEVNGELKRSPNLLAYYATQPGGSLQNAVNKIFKMIHDNDNRIIELKEELQHKYKDEKDFLLFIEETLKTVKGSWIYHSGCDRYYGKIETFPPLSGHFVFDKEKTVIIPADDYDPQIALPYSNFIKQFYRFSK